MKISARSTLIASALGLAFAGVWSADTGCSSSSSSNDTGGSKATGGNGGDNTGGKATGGGSGTGGGTGGVLTATGGGSATGGSGAGTGGGSSPTGGAGAGTGGAANAACTMGAAPSDKLLTDFSASSVVGNVASAGAVGKIYPFPTSGGPTLSLTTGANVALTVTATVPAPDKYYGASLSLDKCTDASTYTGIQFTLSSVTLAGCELRFGVDFAEDVDPIANVNPKGTCTVKPCYGPATTITAATTKVPFADLKYGMPVDGVNAKTILGLAWTLHSPAAVDGGTPADCTNATFTVDDVSFY